MHLNEAQLAIKEEKIVIEKSKNNRELIAKN